MPLLSRQQCGTLKCFTSTYVVIRNLKVLLVQFVSAPFYRWRNRGTKGLKNSPKVTQGGNDKARIYFQAVWALSLCSSHDPSLPLPSSGIMILCYLNTLKDYMMNPEPPTEQMLHNQAPHYLSRMILPHPDQCGSVGWASSHKGKGRRFNPNQGVCLGCRCGP